MTAIKPLDQISAKWSRVSQQSQQSYEDGVRAPRRSWAAETAKAEGNFEKGIQAAIARKSFGKGVRRAGDDKWQKNTLEKGPQRWSQGISLSQDAYEQGFAPYAQVIQATNLPERGPKGDPKNIQRVAIMAKNLHDKKLQLQGGA